ncbi:hypothetical protein A9Q84_01850 [Halobacteriovorax marinus]|uniref:PilZ domain-containing protein n=1 Tax=Halobacteriovorax marinus TaxID=97084 RepID=A0A1Y5FGA6_9BACT|nr:hypothetical protein A9Q84_01850 [Halobacteriovorax marinus]
MKFINIFNPTTQRELLEAIGLIKSPITLWQSLELKKKVMKICMMKVNRYQQQIEFTPKEDKYIFSSQLPVYFYTRHRNCIFKANIIFNSEFKVIAKWPENFMIENGREHERIHPSKRREVFFSLRVNNAFFKEFSKPVIDESKRGISIRIPCSEVQFYDELAVVKVKLRGEIRDGMINYIVPLEGKGQRGFFRIGIVFNKMT